MGMVRKAEDYSYDGYFYLLKSDGTPRKTGRVSYNARHFARTYEESVEIYNGLVREKMEKLRSIADKLEQELL